MAACVVGLALSNGGFKLPNFAATPPPHMFTHTPGRIVVVDGDTIRISGRKGSVRLVGFNAPESHQPACSDERDLGERAKARLKQLVATSRIDFTPVACACKAGTEGTSSCNYGRACGTLRADGEDVGGILIGEGLAVPFHCRGTSCPRTPRPWCG